MFDEKGIKSITKKSRKMHYQITLLEIIFTLHSTDHVCDLYNVYQIALLAMILHPLALAVLRELIFGTTLSTKLRCF